MIPGIQFRYLREIFIAIGFSSNLLGYLLGNFSFSKIIMLIVIVFLLKLSINNGFKILFNTKIVLPIIFLLFIFIVSFLKYDYLYTQTYFVYFLLYSIFSILSFQEKIHFSKVLEYLSIILFLSIPLAVRPQNYDIGYLLGLSYNFLTGYLTAIYLLFFNKEKKSIFVILICVINLFIYSYFYAFFGNRGTILLIVIYLFLKWYLALNKSIIGRVVQFFSAIVSIFVIQNWIQLLIWLNNFLQSLGLNIYAIEKTINLLISNQNIDSGRNFLVNKLFTLVDFDDLFFGKGIGFIETTLGIYSHNLFVQSLFEGGICFTIFLLYVLLKLFGIFAKEKTWFANFVLLATVSVMGQLMLSNVYWLNPIFWFLFYLVFFTREYLEGDKVC
ncbi:hypothetical protein DP112_03270 [Streptococcus suis]|uniref:oligosaccharide repeat unit polymerase n=1 Tax=Streptococcus suis TaxID=1307 RepID=UPI000E0BE541|nr:oligosaccharide repeat unit polymerase [Streptococcus suis]AXI67135.1 hypothetical protein DP112_03270 [Streptococcus suis]